MHTALYLVLRVQYCVMWMDAVHCASMEIVHSAPYGGYDAWCTIMEGIRHGVPYEGEVQGAPNGRSMIHDVPYGEKSFMVLLWWVGAHGAPFEGAWYRLGLVQEDPRRGVLQAHP
jgi:hypothetical protein